MSMSLYCQEGPVEKWVNARLKLYAGKGREREKCKLEATVNVNVEGLPVIVGTCLQIAGLIIHPFFRPMVDPLSIILLHC